ncbi:MAG: phage structural protein [Lachnospiraceae bacterium]
MATTTTYDPEKVNVQVNGSIVTGFASDGVITITMNEDAVTPEVGVQGDVVYAENANRSATVTLTLQGTAAFLEKARSLCLKKKMFPFLLSDANDDGGLISSGTNCRITKMPDIARGKTPGTVSVSFFVPVLQVR